MKPINYFKKEYPDIAFVVNKNSIKVESQYVATVKQGDTSWYSEAQRIPHALEDAANALSRNFNRQDIGNKAKEEKAREDILTCRVVGIIDSAKSVDERAKKVFFEDILICRPIRKELHDLLIYVPQHNGGAFQPNDLRKIVGQLVPVKIFDLKQVVFAKRYNSFIHEKQELMNEYVAIGDINIAEYLVNDRLLKEFTNAKTNDPVLDVQSGYVNYISEKGVFLVTSQMEKIYIPFFNYSYKNRSRILGKDDFVSLGDIVDFRLTSGSYNPPTDKQKALGFEGQIPVLYGERLSLEKNPEEVIKELIDSGKGTVVSGYITDYNPVKGHYLEIEGAYGFPIRLVANEEINKNMFKRKVKISAVIKNGSYKMITPESGKSYLQVKATASYNTSYTDDNGLEEFFVR